MIRCSVFGSLGIIYCAAGSAVFSEHFEKLLFYIRRGIVSAFFPAP